MVSYEIELDRRLLEHVHDEAPGQARRLGRFDRVVTETRKRLPQAPKEGSPEGPGSPG